MVRVTPADTLGVMVSSVSEQLREGLPTGDEMRAATEQGRRDAYANRARAAEHVSYLGKDKHAHAITWAYNCGYIKGRQQLVQDLYGDPPTARMF